MSLSYYERNRERAIAAHRAYMERADGRAAHLIAHRRAWCCKNKAPFSLTTEWAVPRLEAGVCEATGLPLDLSRGGDRKPFGPSIDRIVPALGYVPENCRIVCNIFNMAKNKWTDADVLAMSRAFVEKQEEADDGPQAEELPDPRRYH